MNGLVFSLIAFSFVLLIPISVFAQDSQNVFDKSSRQTAIETVEKFDPAGTIIQTTEYDGIYQVNITVDNTINKIFIAIEDGYVRGDNMGVVGQLYDYDGLASAILMETVFNCYDDCVPGPRLHVGDCFGNLQFDSKQDISGNLQCPTADINSTFSGVWVSSLDDVSDVVSPPEISSGGGCLIATATYGSEMSAQVQQLRELRDNSLLQTESGTTFMNTFNGIYYSFSPYIADYELENPVFKEMVKIVITPMISSLSILNHVEMDSEAAVLGYGISLILLNIGMYVAIPAIVVMGIRKTF